MKRFFSSAGLIALLCCLPPLAAQDRATKKPCHPSLSTCPDSGCKDATSPDGVENVLKHHHPEPPDNLVTLTIDDFQSLQDQIDKRFGTDAKCPGNYRSPSKPQRKHCLSNFKLPHHPPSVVVSEQDFVELIGFLAEPDSKSGPPKANSSGESVNCNLKGADNNDFHINVVAKPGNLEFDGIVVEMIPQDRDSGWTIPKLKAAQKQHLMVRIRGQLMLDNKHRVNSDKNHVIGGQPKRVSVWEIHPVSEFAVCPQKKCTAASGWVELENWKGGQ